MVAKSKQLKTLQNKLFNHLGQKSPAEIEILSKIPVEKILDGHKIPAKVAVSNAISDEPQKLILSFVYFRSNICQYETADSAKLRSLLEKMARITEFPQNQFHTCDLAPRPINRTSVGDYATLFLHLDPDVEKIYEIDIAGYGRFYGFIAGSVFYFIAVDAKHRETN